MLGEISQPHIKKQPALQFLNVQAAFAGNGEWIIYPFSVFATAP